MTDLVVSIGCLADFYVVLIPMEPFCQVQNETAVFHSFNGSQGALLIFLIVIVNSLFFLLLYHFGTHNIGFGLRNCR